MQVFLLLYVLGSRDCFHEWVDCRSASYAAAAECSQSCWDAYEAVEVVCHRALDACDFLHYATLLPACLQGPLPVGFRVCRSEPLSAEKLLSWAMAALTSGHASMPHCIETTAIPSLCNFLDKDADGDIDLADWANVEAWNAIRAAYVETPP